MVNPRAVILRTAGINCEGETKTACERVGFEAELVHVRRVIERPAMLRDFHLAIFPGGFSYGDDLGSGRVLANEVRLFLRDEFRRFVRDGKLVWGICNGFQVLVKSGLLPDPFDDGPPRVTLTFNASRRFESRWVFLKVSSRTSEFIKEGEVLELPVAHGEGRFVGRDERTIEELETGGQVVLRYVTAEGLDASYPENPNGAARGIAGLCDKTGRVFGLMPHPERYQDATQHPEWTRVGLDKAPDGLKFFHTALRYVRERL